MIKFYYYKKINRIQNKYIIIEYMLYTEIY